MKLITLILTVFLLQACSTMNGTQSASRVPPPAAENRPAMFAWAVQDLMQRLENGDVNQLLEIVSDTDDSSGSKTKTFDQSTDLVLVKNLINVFKNEGMEISNIDEPLRTVEIQLLGYPHLPNIWRFELELDSQEYRIRNLNSDVQRLNMQRFVVNQLMNLTRLIRKHPELNNNSAARKDPKEILEDIFNAYSEKDHLNANDAKYLIHLALQGVNNSSKPMLAQTREIIEKTNLDNTPVFDGHILVSAVYDQDYNTALEYLYKLKGQINSQSVFSTTEAYYLFQLDRHTEAASAVRRAMSYQTDNIWAYAIANGIAKKQGNYTLQQELRATYDNIFIGRMGLPQLTSALLTLDSPR